MEQATIALEAIGERVVFLDHFKELPDPRQRGKITYPLDEVLLLCLLAVLGGAETFVDIARFGEKKIDLLRRFRPFRDGTPSHDHLGDIFATLDAKILKRSPDTATLEDIRRFQLHLAETGLSICSRNRTMTGLRFLFRVTLRRLDLAEEVYHIREPQKLPLVMSVDEMKRLLAVASSLKTRVLLSLGYGCGLRASEIVRLKVKHIDSAQNIIRIEQSKGRKDRNVMLSPEMLDLLRQWWKVRPSRYDAEYRCRNVGCFPAESLLAGRSPLANSIAYSTKPPTRRG
jgi:integrase